MYSRHRFPGEIISYCVWLYYTFPLSYRDLEKMMLYRGIEVTYETIREWCQKFGQMKNVEHRPHKGLNNRAENSHQLTRVRERRVRRFKSPGQAQRFLSAFGSIRDHFHPKQHQLTATRYRQELRQRFEDWREVVGLKSAR